MTDINLDQSDARARVLACLKFHAPNKVSTWELILLTHHSRSAGRCWELIREGYRIEKTNEGRTFYWRYVGEPLPATEPEQVGLFAMQEAS